MSQMATWVPKASRPWSAFDPTPTHGAIVAACENWGKYDLPDYPEEQVEDFSNMGECVRAAIDEMEEA